MEGSSYDINEQERRQRALEGTTRLNSAPTYVGVSDQARPLAH